jgi:hypothetical protein
LGGGKAGRLLAFKGSNRIPGGGKSGGFGLPPGVRRFDDGTLAPMTGISSITPQPNTSDLGRRQQVQDAREGSQPNTSDLGQVKDLSQNGYRCRLAATSFSKFRPVVARLRVRNLVFVS